ncbi:MAG: gamma-glutamyl-gamma-aminobutyrate hydrolase family protein [Fimbriimonadaceae bacterium]
MLGLTSKNSGNDGERCHVGRPYMDGILAAGGLPLGLPPGCPPADVYAAVDGLMLIGGPDIDPANYGEPRHDKTEVVALDRWETERALIGQRPAGMPVLGVCYGCQALAAMAGGSMIQHLPDTIGDDRHSGGTLQQILVEEGSLLHQLVGTTMVEGKSYHHQAIKEPGTGMRVAARCGDVIEAIEGDGWVLGIQWHPERTPESQSTKRIFRGFVEACKTYREEAQSCGTW